MVALDATNREVCAMRRQRTSTPLAALVLLNDPTFVEAARMLAEELLRSANGNIEKCIEQAFSRTLSRSPSRQERDELMSLYNDQVEVYRQDPDAATDLLGVGESPRNETLPAVVHAALTCVTSVILNFDETLSKE